jgi:hypothetical protein
MLEYLAAVTLEQESTEEIGIIKKLVVSRKLFAHQKIKLAFKILEKIERRANAINHYSLLNEIYLTMVQNAHLLDDETQEAVFFKFERNRDELVEQGKLNMVYSIVTKAYTKVELKGETIDLNRLLSDAYKRFNISKERGYNFMSMYQLAQIADLAGGYSKKYHSVDLFFEDKLVELEGGTLDTEKHLIYHIDLLYLFANIYFRKRQFTKSIYYLEKMLVQMRRFDNRYYDEKIVQYTTLQALNLNYQGKFKSAEVILDDLIKTKKYNNEELLNPYLTKALIHFQQNELPAAKKIISQFTRTDIWYERNMGLEWILNKNFMEILLHIEMENLDYVDSRITSMKRKIKEAKIDQIDSRIGVFLRLTQKFHENPNMIHSADFQHLIQSTIELKPSEEEDIFMMSFYAWLKSKISKTNIYNLTLEMVSLENKA